LAARLAGVVGALAVPFQLFEQLDQRALAELARSLRSDLEAATRPGHQPGPLQGAFDLSETPQVAHGIFTQGSTQPLLVHVLERGPGVVGLHRPVQLLVVGEALQRVDRRLHRQGLLATGQGRLAPGHLREHLRERPGQPVDLEGQVHVLEDLTRERLQLGPLLRRHRGQQPGQGGHPPGHLFEQLVEGPRISG
jgi:hypothetical protein